MKYLRLWTKIFAIQLEIHFVYLSIKFEDDRFNYKSIDSNKLSILNTRIYPRLFVLCTFAYLAFSEKEFSFLFIVHIKGLIQAMTSAQKECKISKLILNQ